MIRQTETIEVITRDQPKRRWLAAEKEALVGKTCEPGKSFSLVARWEAVATILLFASRKLERDGAMGQWALKRPLRRLQSWLRAA